MGRKSEAGTLMFQMTSQQNPACIDWSYFSLKELHNVALSLEATKLDG